MLILQGVTPVLLLRAPSQEHARLTNVAKDYDWTLTEETISVQKTEVKPK